jgi:lambda repressor-like predicted transcriptional regulator
VFTNFFKDGIIRDFQATTTSFKSGGFDTMGLNNKKKQVVVIVNIEDEIRRLRDSRLSRTAAAKALNVDRAKFDLMLEAIDLSWDQRGNQGRYEIDGIRDSLDRHAERLGIGVGALRFRLAQNQDLEGPSRIRPVTNDEAAEFVRLRREGISAQQSADQVGRPYNTLKNAAKRLFPDYEEVVAKATGLVTKEEAERFLELRRSGKTGTEAALEMGRNRQVLARAVVKHCTGYEDVLSVKPAERRVRKSDDNEFAA